MRSDKWVLSLLVSLAIVVTLFVIISFQEAGAQGGTHVSTVSIWWDEYAERASAEPVQWTSLIEFELRQGDEVLAAQGVVPDCEAADEPGAGQCGSDVSVTWDGLDPGAYQVWVRGTWTDGSETIYMKLDGGTEGNDHFWLLEEFSVDYVYYFPIILK